MTETSLLPSAEVPQKLMNVAAMLTRRFLRLGVIQESMQRENWYSIGKLRI